MCGILVCGSCTTKKMTLSGGKEERCCDCCFNRVKSHIGDLTREAADRSRLMAKIDRGVTEGGDDGSDESDESEDDEEGEENNRDDLFRGAAAPGKKEEGRGGRGGGGGGGGGGGAHSAMAEGLQNLGARGEKLERINDKTEAMQSAAKDFKEMAKKLNQQQKSSWF